MIMYPTTEKEALDVLKGDDPELAATAGAILWSIWCRSGDPEIDRSFRAGIEAMQQQKLADAEELFSRVGGAESRLCRRTRKMSREGLLNRRRTPRLRRGCRRGRGNRRNASGRR